MRKLPIITRHIVRAGISFTVFIGLSQFFISNVTAASLQPSSLTLPMAIAGQKYSEPLLLSGFEHNGCYRVVAKNIVSGLTILPKTTCTTNGMILRTHIIGVASVKDYTISSTANILVEAIPITAKVPTRAWTVQLPIIPAASVVPSLKTIVLDLAYSGTMLTHISCPAVGDYLSCH